MFLHSMTTLLEIGAPCSNPNGNGLRLTRDVAEASGSLLAGGICDTGLYYHDDSSDVDEIKDIFKEQVEWAVEEGVDYIIGETFKTLGEAKLGLEIIQQYGKGVPAVITISAYVPDVTFDGVPRPDACLEMEKCGAAVVGLNCARGPATMLPLIKQIKRVCQVPVAALPIVYRTSDTQHTWHSLRDADTGGFCFPLNVQCYQCKRSDIRDFAEQAKSAGVQYIGLCCGNASHYTREIAVTYGRTPGVSKYSPTMVLSNNFSENAKEDEHKKKMRIHMRGEDAI